MIRIVFIIISFIFQSTVSCYGLDSLIIDNQFSEHIIYGNELEVLEDPYKKFSIEEIISNSDLNNKFILNNFYAPKNINKKSAYWIRFKVANIASPDKIWLLECYDQTIDFIEAYLPDGKGGYIKKIAGDKLLFSKRTFQHKNFEFLGPTSIGKGYYYYYFRFEANDPITMIVALRSIDKFVYYSLNEYICFGLFYGIILVISFYNLLMYFAMKNIQYIYYVLYVLSVGVYSASTDGVAYQYLWSSYPWINQIAVGFSLYLVIIAALLFTRLFLNIPKKHPFLDKIIIGIIILRTLFFLIALFFYNELFEYKVVEVLPLSIAFYAGIISFYKKYSPARFFVVSYGFLFCGFLIRFLVFIEIVPFSIISHYSINFSIVLEMIFLSFALADKVRIIKDTKERAQKRIIKQYAINVELKDKVNKELEDKVNLRTIEIAEKNKLLEVANNQLKEQAEEINQMNVVLDIDNSKLKKNIQEVMVSRVMKQNIEYEEFEKIFPDELTCLRYLDEVKWVNGYLCKKCGNDKYFEGTQLFARRCTRCGYNESITSNTIFQGVKFPIDKAFYITYTVITERDDITLDQLSEILELRRNTCWNFKKKLMKIIDSDKAKRARAALKNWGYVVFNYIEEK